MTAIFCDICKKNVASARKDVNYTVILDKDLCVPCGEELLDVVRHQMLPRHPFTFKDYRETLVKNLERMTSR
jgi:hypothetical protein